MAFCCWAAEKVKSVTNSNTGIELWWNYTFFSRRVHWSGMLGECPSPINFTLECFWVCLCSPLFIFDTNLKCRGAKWLILSGQKTKSADKYCTTAAACFALHGHWEITSMCYEHENPKCYSSWYLEISSLNDN